MSNFHITYNHPWLLLLIIPAVLLTLIPYFLMNRKYRKTRNRIISMALHITVSVIAVNLLAGLSFAYEVPNRQNELILLVDTSESGEDVKAERDSFVGSVINVAGDDCKIGVVKYGWGCSVAVELTDNKDGAYDKYFTSPDPDGTATALEDALKYTAGLFTRPETAKIVIVSDGIETDGDALSALGGIVSQGIKVDSAYFGAEQKDDIMILSCVRGEGAIAVDEPFEVELTVFSNSTQTQEAAILRLYDDGVERSNVPIILENGINTYPASLFVDSVGVHELTFEVITDGEILGNSLKDECKQNNQYRIYVNVEEFGDVLLIENYEGEGEKLKSIIGETKTVTDISVEEDIDEFPKTIEELAEYDEVVLVNIAYSDMPGGFEQLLYEYVHELGGGLLTVGGENDTDAYGNPVAHAYNRADIEKSAYFKDMLPVNATNYTPPIAVLLVIDTSTSVSKEELNQAVDGALVCLDALHDRDYCGVMSFTSDTSEKIPLLPVSKKDEIIDAINKVRSASGGGTTFSKAIDFAGGTIAAVDNVEKKHIILITDGEPNDAYEEYSEQIQQNKESGITMSVITFGLDNPTHFANMGKIAELGGGRFHNVEEPSGLSGKMYEELTQKEITEIAYGQEFSLGVKDWSSALAGVDDIKAIPPLTGYYGTVAKKDATVTLVGEYVPIYAFHKYGKGTVGSFMCDLNGTWSEKFIIDPVGKKIISNIVSGLLPTDAIRTDNIQYELKKDNYSYQLSVYGASENEETTVQITPMSDHLQALGAIDVTAYESGRRFSFFITEPGLYEIRIKVTGEDAEIVADIPIYETHSYSEEYATSLDGSVSGAVNMAILAKAGEGSVIDDHVQAFSGFTKTLRQKYEPRAILIVLAIILFLLDIAVRKFKWKWIHELIHDRKMKK